MINTNKIGMQYLGSYGTTPYQIHHTQTPHAYTNKRMCLFIEMEMKMKSQCKHSSQPPCTTILQCDNVKCVGVHVFGNFFVCVCVFDDSVSAATTTTNENRLLLFQFFSGEYARKEPEYVVVEHRENANLLS